MAGKLGRKVLLKLGDGEVSEAFTAVATLTAKTFSLNSEDIDNTADDSVDSNDLLWRETLRGINSATIGGDGKIKDHASEAAIHTTFMATDNVANWQVVLPGVGTYEGPFRLNQMELAGGDADLTYSLSLASAGAVGFTAE